MLEDNSTSISGGSLEGTACDVLDNELDCTVKLILPLGSSVSKLPVDNNIPEGMDVEEPATPLWSIRHVAAARVSERSSDDNSDRNGEVDGCCGGEQEAGSGVTADTSCPVIVSKQHLDDQVLAREDGAGEVQGCGPAYSVRTATRKIGSGLFGAGLLMLAGPPVMVGAGLVACSGLCVGATTAMMEVVSGSRR